MATRQNVRRTLADVLRARGKLGPYKEETVPKTTRYGGPTNESDPTAEPDVAPVVDEPADEETVEPASVDQDSPVPPGEPYDTWLLVELKDECGARQLPTSGNKADLIARLVASDEEGSE